MVSYTESLTRRITKLRIKGSRRNLQASKQQLRCWALHIKSSEHSMRIMKYEHERNIHLGRVKHYESKITDMESRFPNIKDLEFAKREVERSKTRASELNGRAKLYENRIRGEREKIEECRKKAQEHLRKSEELKKEANGLETEAVNLETKLGGRTE